LAEPAVDLPTPLSQRERQILRLLAGGLSNDDIAANLFLSTNTVKTHLKRIFEKMGVSNRLEAVNMARRAKII
jgi:LuxR family maltose regulon positive regulatory protein